jgi:hypothetical protein
MRVRPFFDIKMGGVGFSRKPGEQSKCFQQWAIINDVPYSM